MLSFLCSLSACVMFMQAFLNFSNLNIYHFSWEGENHISILKEIKVRETYINLLEESKLAAFREGDNAIVSFTCNTRTF